MPHCPEHDVALRRVWGMVLTFPACFLHVRRKGCTFAVA